MARLGVSTDVIDECLNHKLQSKVSRVYIQDRRQDEQARAFDALGQRLAELTGDKAATNVVPIRAGDSHRHTNPRPVDSPGTVAAAVQRQDGPGCWWNSDPTLTPNPINGGSKWKLDKTLRHAR